MGLGMVGTLHCILPDSFILWSTYCLAVRASRGPEATDGLAVHCNFTSLWTSFLCRLLVDPEGLGIIVGRGLLG